MFITLEWEVWFKKFKKHFVQHELQFQKKHFLSHMSWWVWKHLTTLLLSNFYHESLRTWIKTIDNKFAISKHTALILGVHALRSHSKLICEYEFHRLPNKKVSGAKDHGKNYIKVRLPLIRHFWRDRLSQCANYHGSQRCLGSSSHSETRRKLKKVNDLKVVWELSQMVCKVWSSSFNR